MSTTEHLRTWALHLAASGWRVFPVTPGAKKPPMIRDWEHRATTDPHRITRCWHGGGQPFNIGVATGPSGLVVLDLDPTKTPGAPDGATALATLATTRGVTLPPTYTVSTPRRGRHLYLRNPPGVHLRNTSGTLAPALDTRAHGGYVLGPGSLRPDGGYELFDDTDPVELPAWLVQVLTDSPAQPRSAPAQRVRTDPGGYVGAALRGEADKVRHAPPGQHNAVLCRAAYALGQLLGARLLDENTARAELTAAGGFLIGADCDCTNTEVARVIEAGLAAGARNPRRATARTSNDRGAA
ncbi:MAG: bifunctional DNA primase/polymerase [Pseudonocardiaceae bacterium]